MLHPQASAPLISVVLATNRGGPFLEEALAGVAAQTYPNVEVLLVDDGSPDPVALRAAASAAPQVRLTRTDPQGVSAARNLGVALSEGTLLAFLDDDDVWYPDRLQSHVAVMADAPDVVASYCRMRTIDEHGNELVPGDQRPARDEHDVIRGRSGVLLGNLVIRRDVVTAIGGFDPAYRQAEDLDLILRAALMGRFAFVDEVGVGYRFHGANTTQRYQELAGSIRTIVGAHQREAHERGRSDLVADYAERLRANDRFAAWSAARAARSHLVERDVVAAARDLWWAARFAPTVPLNWIRVRWERHRHPEPPSSIEAGSAPVAERRAAS